MSDLAGLRSTYVCNKSREPALPDAILSASAKR